MNTANIVKMTDTLEMVGFLKANGTQCRFVAMVSDTPVTDLKVSCPFKNVRKVARKMGIINANYNTSVRRRIAERLGVKLSEVEYENGKVWYKHVMTADGKPLPLCVHKTKENGKWYIQYFPHKSTAKYVLPNGEEVTKEQLEPYFYASSERDDFKPCVIAIDLSNVKELRASGVIIQMPDLEAAEAILSQ